MNTAFHNIQKNMNFTSGTQQELSSNMKIFVLTSNLLQHFLGVSLTEVIDKILNKQHVQFCIVLFVYTFCLLLFLV